MERVGDDDYECDERLDLNRHLIKHPSATFFVRVNGDSMLGAGIHPGDILVVDRACECGDGDLVVAECDDVLTITLLPAEGRLFGKVLHVIHTIDAGGKTAPSEEGDEWPDVIGD
jgi:SOS-response transcriptional repressor LexA